MGDQPGTGRRFWTLHKALLALAGLLFVRSLVGLVLSTRSHGDDFTEIATGQFLGTLVMFQLRVIPAYLVVALAYTVVLFPFLHRRPALIAAARRRPGLRARLRLLALTLGASVLLGLLSVGPFFTRNPGLLDGLARKMGGRFDWYALHRWHLLDAATVAFGLVAGYAALWYGLRWWRARPRGARLALWAAPLVLLAGGAALALRPASAPPAAADTPPNVLIIASDSLRYDRLGVHGHDRDSSPNIDAFARGAVDFEQLHVATASTLESWITFMSSRLPPNHGVRYMYLRKEQAEAASKLPDLLPRLLNAAGYATIASSNWAGNCFALVDVGFTHNLVSDTQNFDAFIMETTIWTHLIFPLYFSNDFGEFLLPEATRTTKYLRPSVLVDKLFDQVDAATRAGQLRPAAVLQHDPPALYGELPLQREACRPAYWGQHQYEIEVTVHDLTTGFDPHLPPDTIQHIRDLYHDGTVAEFDHYVGETLQRLEARAWPITPSSSSPRSRRGSV
ncbi:MAG: sulfatase-like hydrolase/transferase [bacterium]